jgi:hypothetical protein
MRIKNNIFEMQRNFLLSVLLPRSLVTPDPYNEIYNLNVRKGQITSTFLYIKKGAKVLAAKTKI